MESALQVVKRASVASVITVVAVLFHLVSVTFGGAKERLALIPSSTMLSDYYPWNLFTCALFEENTIKLVLMLLLFVRPCSLIQARWGGFNVKYTAAYLFAVDLLSGLIVFAARIALFRYDGDYLFTGNYGLGGLVVAAVIGVVETNADEPVTPSTIMTYRQALIPCLLVYTVFALAFPLLINDLPMVFLSVPFSFLFLHRFPPDIVVLGQERSTLLFQDFFPLPLRPSAQMLARLFSCICCCCVKSSTTTQSTGGERQMARQSLSTPANVDPVAERRRAKALKALDAKLAQIAQEPEISFDDNDDDDWGS